MSLINLKKNITQYNLVMYKPLTPSLRHVCLINKRKCWGGKYIRQLCYRVKSNAGRSKNGNLILYTRSYRFHKRIYRKINFLYFNFGIPSSIHRIEYDPYRSSFITLNIYKNGLVCYGLQTKGSYAGAVVHSYIKNPTHTHLKNGDSFLLKYIPEGSMIHSIEESPFLGSKYSRAAGTFCTMIRKYLSTNKCLVKLKSGTFKIFSMNCRCILGSVSNSDNQYVQYGKAGRSRWLGIKPNVRGVAMNPVDHPHGGGEGKKSKKVSPRSSWGKMYKWIKTSTSRSKLLS